MAFAATAVWTGGVQFSAAQGQVDWIRYYGTPGPDLLNDVSTDGMGSVYVAGSHPFSSNTTQAALLKYDVAGNLLWTRTYRKLPHHTGAGVSADGLGSVYAVGTVNDNFVGGPFSVYLTKFDANGTEVWGRQLDSVDSAGIEFGTDVAADGLGSIYISGYTNGSFDGMNAGADDAFVSKYDAAGTLLWTRQFGTAAYDRAHGVAVDGLGSVYLAGTTNGNQVEAGADALLIKYDAAGTLLWSRVLGTAGVEVSTGVSADSLGNVYITGRTNGDLAGPSSGGTDAFLSKYSSDGTLVWTRQFGTGEFDAGLDVSVDGLGNVFASGVIEGVSVVGSTIGDAFVSKFDAAGTQLWYGEIASQFEDEARGVAANGSGSVFIAGPSYNEQMPTGQGESMVARLSIPEPGGAMLAALMAAPLALAVRRRGRAAD